MKRRAVIAVGLAFLAASGSAWTQTGAKRVAILTAGNESSVPRSLHEALKYGLRDGGFVEGRNLALDWRYADDDAARLRELAAELVRSKVDLILAINTPAALAAKRATNAIPIVFVRVGDPVGVGLVASLARPGGNATGFVPFTVELAGKRLAMLKEILPGITHVAVLYVSSNQGAAFTFKQIGAAAPKLGMTVRNAGVVSQAAIQPAIEAAARNGAGALMLVDDVVITSSKAAIIETSLKHGLPVSSIYREIAESGGLIAYGPNPGEVYSGAAGYAVRILRGANPGDLPVQQPARFELIINLKSASALQLTVPQSVLATADEIIR